MNNIDKFNEALETFKKEAIKNPDKTDKIIAMLVEKIDKRIAKLESKKKKVEKMNNKELIELAKEARKNAFAPISNYYVGSALLTKDGKVYLGCNVEDPSGVGVTNVCGERCAFIKALSEGQREFVSIAIVGGFEEKLELATPCGICRQYMMNFNPNLQIICEENGEIKEFILKDLLPNAWYKDISKEN